MQNDDTLGIPKDLSPSFDDVHSIPDDLFQTLCEEIDIPDDDTDKISNYISQLLNDNTVSSTVKGATEEEEVMFAACCTIALENNTKDPTKDFYTEVKRSLETRLTHNSASCSTSEYKFLNDLINNASDLKKLCKDILEHASKLPSNAESTTVVTTKTAKRKKPPIDCQVGEQGGSQTKISRRNDDTITRTNAPPQRDQSTNSQSSVDISLVLPTLTRPATLPPATFSLNAGIPTQLLPGVALSPLPPLTHLVNNTNLDGYIVIKRFTIDPSIE